MNHKALFLLIPAVALTGCETLQSPQQRRQAQAREQAAQRHQEEQVYRVKGQVESVEMENARLMQELQQLRAEARSYNSQISQLNGRMTALEAKQKREMDELIRRVEALLKKTVASRPAPKASRSGREHVVESGHTLSAIAAAYGTTVSAIKRENNLKSDSIYVGQKLFIPE
ncbi:putative endopeptidase p60 [Pontiella desulfatans]|uniref:Putative endopeptidase p60 n=1 Tax=Pontiella desulfatans TaxID=2750659 RepID=A0A6C2UDY0_PONDE|nr:LysM peptidoglycan-binding domain-containing protein [Pontiella desulfatans]VGO17416.1 putative endopeptidase p60 [Pontiella desulfatans]